MCSSGRLNRGEHVEHDDHDRGILPLVSRLQRFRAFMARMNPTADPLAAIRDGLFVERPGSVWSALQRRLEVDPVSTHLVLGGIGSGKTSEVLVSARRLLASLRPEGDHVGYCDVSKTFDLDGTPTQGALVALAGLDLIRTITKSKEERPQELERTLNEFRRFAHGYDFHEDYGDATHVTHYPGVVDAWRGADWQPEASEYVDHLRTILASVPGGGRHAVFFFDSLDRLPRPENFVIAVRNDIMALKRAGIGAIVVGPVRYVAGNDRGLTELFEHTHFQLSVDPRVDVGLGFLSDVLRRRAGEGDLLPEECLRPLALASGGVLRDLITLAKRAAEEAYVAGRDSVGPPDVAAARDAMGRGLAVGLDDEQLKALDKVHATEKFVVRGERELSLLETRRVLMYEGNRWAVHPALAPLLGLMSEGS